MSPVQGRSGGHHDGGRGRWQDVGARQPAAKPALCAAGTPDGQATTSVGQLAARRPMRPASRRRVGRGSGARRARRSSRSNVRPGLESLGA
jgi:hypothetical protein